VRQKQAEQAQALIEERLEAKRLRDEQREKERLEQEAAEEARIKEMMEARRAAKDDYERLKLQIASMRKPIFKGSFSHGPVEQFNKV